MRAYLQCFVSSGQSGGYVRTTFPGQRDGTSFCLDTATEAEATFLARPPLRVCDGDRSDGDDLRARYVDCRTARRAYRLSLRAAARQSDRKVIRFRALGYRWRCRAYNPHKRNDNPAWYEWKCRASHDVLVHYRWFAGE